MDNLIPMMRDLRAAFATVKGSSDVISLPEIVVIGSQSAGKSSLLERIVGKDFLPRGKEITTRQPLILDLINMPTNDKRRSALGLLYSVQKCLGAANDKDFAIFDEDRKTVYTDFSRVRNNIQAITDRDCGTQDGIVEDEIKLRVYSDRFVNLSLVDLPGITNVPVGDQPDNIGDLLRSMIAHYISNKNTIILAVTPANQDFATSEALKLAKDADPEGDRTLAVITKLDLMDKGTDAMDVLKGKVIPVKLGIVGVRNRCYAQMDQPMEEADREEIEFLNEHYAEIAGKHGVRHLTRMLSEMLTRHIEKVLPSMSREISENMIKYGEMLAEFGEDFAGPGAANHRIVMISHEFCFFYKEQTLEGFVDLCATSDGPAALMSSIFHEQLVAEVSKIQPLEGLTADQIHSVVRNSQGLNLRLSIPAKVFKLILKPKIEMLNKAALLCVDQIRNEMSAAAGKFNNQNYFNRYPRLRERIIQLVADKLDELTQKTKNYVSHSILSESAYINAKHTGFEDRYNDLVDKIMGNEPAASAISERSGPVASTAAKQSLNAKPDVTDESSGYHIHGNVEDIAANVGKKVSDLDRRHINLIFNIVVDYFDIIRNNVTDTVPKLIVFGMIEELHNELEMLLLSKLHKTDGVEALFVEDEVSVKRHQYLKDVLEVLTTASNTIRAFVPAQMTK